MFHHKAHVYNILKSNFYKTALGFKYKELDRLQFKTKILQALLLHLPKDGFFRKFSKVSLTLIAYHCLEAFGEASHLFAMIIINRINLACAILDSGWKLMATYQKL